MIEKEQFITGMALLSGAFGREVDGPIQRAYYAVLSKQLTTAEFERAVSITLETETFWPSPAVLIGKVKQDTQARALSALEHVNRVTGQAGGYRFLPVETFHREFDAPTRVAIAAVGGLGAIGNVSEDRYSTLQKKFVAAYSESLQPRIAAPETDKQVKRLTSKTAAAMVSGRDRAAGDRP